ncbi:MAG: hypothetical protein OCD01_05575 [Fibrobacterales bacterium]
MFKSFSLKNIILFLVLLSSSIYADTSHCSDLDCDINTLSQLIGSEAQESYYETNNHPTEPRMTVIDISCRLIVIRNLTSIDEEIQKISELEELHLHNCDYIEDLYGFVAPSTQPKLPKLSVLKIYESILTSLDDLRYLKSIKVLQVGGNVDDISVLSELTHLEEINLENNNVSDISTLPSLPSLKKLFLANNQITDENTISELTSLEILNLSKNSITSMRNIGNSLVNLVELDLSGNSIIELSDISNLVSLTKLVLNSASLNTISGLSVKNTELEVIDLSYNSIIDASPLANLQGLEEINIIANDVSDLSFLYSLPYIKKIEFMMNEVFNIDPLWSLPADIWSHSGALYNAINYNRICNNEHNIEILYNLADRGARDFISDGLRLQSSPTFCGEQIYLSKLGEGIVKVNGVEIEQEPPLIFDYPNGSDVEIEFIPAAGYYLHDIYLNTNYPEGSVDPKRKKPFSGYYSCSGKPYVGDGTRFTEQDYWGLVSHDITGEGKSSNPIPINNMVESQTVHVVFKSYLNIDVVLGSGGVITPGTTSGIAFGSNLSFLVNPNNDWRVTKLLIDNKDEIDVAGNGVEEGGDYIHEFQNIVEDHSFEAIYERSHFNFKVYITSGNATVDGSSNVSSITPVISSPNYIEAKFLKGTSGSITVKPIPGETLLSVSIDDISMTKEWHECIVDESGCEALTKISMDVGAGVSLSNGEGYTFNFEDLTQDHKVEITTTVCNVKNADPSYIKSEVFSGTGNVVETYSFLNGFGEIVQKQDNIGANKHLVSAQYNNEYGKLYRSPKPFVYDNATAIFQQMDCSNCITEAIGEYSDQYAFNEMKYTSDPNQSLIEQGTYDEAFSLATNGHHDKQWKFGVLTSTSFIAQINLSENYLDNTQQDSEAASYFLKVYKSPDGNYSQVIVDKRGVAIKQRSYPDISGMPGEITTETLYDDKGQMLESVSADPTNKTTYTYNTIGGVTSVTSVDDGLTQYKYDNVGRLRYSKNQNQLSNSTAGNNLFTIFSYDNLNRQIGVSVSDGTLDFNSPNAVINSSNTIQKATSIYDVVPALNTYLGWTANVSELGEVEKELQNSRGNLVAVISYGEFNEKIADVFSYDEKGRVIAKYKIINALTPIQKFSYSYSAYDALMTQTYENRNSGAWIEQHKKSYVYDSQNRLKEIQHGSMGATPKKSIEYEYNRIGLVENERYFDYATSSVREELVYTYNLRDQIKKIDGNKFEQDIDYELSCNGATTGKYDGSLKCSKMTYRYGATNGVIAEEYTYDGANQLTNILSSTIGIGVNPQTGGGYTYDNIGRFVTKREKGPDLVSGAENMSYNYESGSNRLASVDAVVTATTTRHHFLYDPMGNLAVDFEKNMYVEYDYRGMAKAYHFFEDLTYGTTVDTYNEFIVALGTFTMKGVVKMMYDAGGQRVSKTVYEISATPTPGTEVVVDSIVYLDNEAVLELASTNDLYISTVNYSTPTGVVGAARRTEAGVETEYFYLRDHLGSTRMAFNATAPAGNVVNANAYQGFGDMLNFYTSGTKNGRQLFTGKELDKDGYDGATPADDRLMDLSYFGARYYNAGIGMWASADPARQHFSGYAYGSNNPINRIDPNGLEDVIIYDQSSLPVDDGAGGNDTYTAQVYVRDDDGNILGPYRGSSYPNTIGNDLVGTDWNTTNANETFLFNNANGHSGGTQRGLNIVDVNGNRVNSGINREGDRTVMQFVNIHSGTSNNGNYNSRGSRGCVTIHPDDWAAFNGNFNWSGGNTGGSSGHIYIYRNGQNNESPTNIPIYNQSGI